MTAPPHRIRRLVLEVTLADEEAAWSVQSELARLYGPSLEAIIDRCCAEASDPDRTLRIESLELDLGTLSQDNLEAELLARIGLLLGEALAVRLAEQADTASDAGEPAATTARLELVAYFAKTGNLPWWAEASRPQLIDKTLGQLLQDSAAAVVSLMGELLREPAALQRLVRHCGDERLAQLLAVLTAAWAPQSIGWAGEVERILRAGETLPGAAADSYRGAFWSAVFGTLSSAGTDSAGPMDFWGSVLTQTAAGMSMTYRDLLTALVPKPPQRTEQAGTRGTQQESAAVDQLLSGLIDEMREKTGRTAEAARAPGNAPPPPEPGSPTGRDRVAERPGSVATTGAAAEPGPRWPQGEVAELDVQAELSSGDDPDSGPAAQLELVAYFAKTGNLPRWAEASRPQLIDKTLGQLLQDSAAAVVALMGEISREPAAMQRLVRHCGDERLAQLLAVLTAAWAPQSIGRAGEVERILRAGETLPGAAADSYRGAFWSAVFGTLSSAGTNRAGPMDFWGSVLEQTAAEMSMTYRELLTALVPKLPQRTEQAGTLGAQQEPAAVAQLLGGLLSGLLDESAPPPPKPGSPAWPGALLDTPGLAMPRVAELKDAAVAGDPEGTQEALEVQTPRALRPNTRSSTAPDAGRKPPRPNLAYSDTDEVYVENAGLVILWPFLELFFTRLELMEDKKFKDAAALHRAAGLVGYLVNGEPSPPEYQLALPKVLCGLETAQVFNFGPPVTEAEAEEGASLLAAVIANAPILKEMSVDGFRGTFLMRKGVLSAESGAWLLRVERVSYDVVLDRFPWGVSWVKLPWMEAPLSVEW